MPAPMPVATFTNSSGEEVGQSVWNSPKAMALASLSTTQTTPNSRSR
jgi:hypothetical protein